MKTFVVILALLCPGLAMAAGTCTQTHYRVGIIRTLEFVCVADATDGSFPETVVATRFEGTMVGFSWVVGDTAPTNGFDVVLERPNGHDVLEGGGANINPAADGFNPIVYSGTGIQPLVDEIDELTLKITGNSINSAEVTLRFAYALGH